MTRLLIVALIFTGAGCAGGTGYADRSLSASSLEETVVSHHRQIRALSGSGTISVETPEIAQSVSFELVLRKPDSVLVRIEGPFGIDLGLALITRSEFFFYNSMENRVLSGPTNAANLGRVLRIKLEFEDMMNLFSGGALLSNDIGRPSSLEIIDDEYVLTYEHPAGVRKYWIDPRSLQIVQIHHLDKGGRVLIEQTFTSFQKADGTIVPRLLRAVMRPERRRLSISYSDLAVNPASVSFHYEIPSDAERARLQ